MTDTLISAERARDYLNILSSSAVRYSASSEYRRGAVEMADKMAVYLDFLIDEPEADRPVLDDEASLDHQDAEHDRGVAA